MADSWAGNPATWTAAEAVTAAKMNTEIRDRMDALLAGLKGDTSADSDIRQAVKNGTLAARPAASLAGREYFATDTRQMFIDTGSTWRHVSGSLYDSFQRANSTTLGTSDSGHSWTESSGDEKIQSNRMEATTAGMATVDTGGVIESAKFNITLLTHTTQASINISLMFRWVDANNFLWAQLTSALWRTGRRIAGVDATLATLSLTPAANQLYTVDVNLNGPVFQAGLYGIGASQSIHNVVADNPADTFTSFNTATKCGILFQNTGTDTADRVEAFAVKF